MNSAKFSVISRVPLKIGNASISPNQLFFFTWSSCKKVAELHANFDKKKGQNYQKIWLQNY